MARLAAVVQRLETATAALTGDAAQTQVCVCVRVCVCVCVCLCGVTVAPLRCSLVSFLGGKHSGEHTHTHTRTRTQTQTPPLCDCGGLSGIHLAAQVCSGDGLEFQRSTFSASGEAEEDYPSVLAYDTVRSNTCSHALLLLSHPCVFACSPNLLFPCLPFHWALAALFCFCFVFC